MSILITGGTGFIGRRLIAKLDHCVVTSRDAVRAEASLRDAVDDVIEWKSPDHPLEIPSGLAVDGVVNLIGESIAEGRWNDAKKNRIRSSRIEATNRLVESVLQWKSPPAVVVSASAVSIYGDCGDEILTEERQTGTGFLADVCKDWERATQPLTAAGIRVVILRIGIVLGAEGGALKSLLPLFKLGVGGKLGNGQHYISWIHIEDLVELIRWSINTPSVTGPVNATAPNPIRNAEFTQVLAQAVKRPAIVPVPAFALRLGLGDFADSLLASQRVVPNVALAAGFQFQYSNVRLAIQNVVES